jgi:SAM-dependent methyltransferase
MIRSESCPRCYLCQSLGEILYECLRDRLFSAAGEWNLALCPNRECGLMWLDPMPLEADLGKAYAKYFTHEALVANPRPPLNFLRRALMLVQSAYLAHRFNCGERAGRRLQWLLALPITLSRIECDGLDIPLSYLTGSQRGRMLDVGCGDGRLVRKAQELGWDAAGVDFDPLAIEAGRRGGLNVHTGRLEDLHFPDDSFDLVLMSHVIEHLYDPRRTLSEISRILRAGGTLVVTTPNAGGAGHRRFGSDWVHLDPPRHLRLFTAANLRTLVESIGFHPKKIRSSLRITPLTFVSSRSIRRTGRAYELRWPTLLAELYGRIGSAAQLFIRAWYPLAADELLLEAHK